MRSKVEKGFSLLNISREKLKNMVIGEVINQVLNLDGDNLGKVYSKIIGKDNFLKMKNNSEILRRRICYKIQKDRFGGMKKIHQSRINKLAKQGGLAGVSQKKDKYKPPIGTKLVRVWRGEKYEVTAEESGFEYRGKIYKSLTKLATEITGVKRSGPTFFGLRKEGQNCG